MHKTYASKGLVAISVSVDSMEDGTRDRVLKFLREQDATLTNFWLNEEQEVWQKKFRSDFVPFVYVFNREGKWTQFKNDPNQAEASVDYGAIEKLVVQLLNQK